MLLELGARELAVPLRQVRALSALADHALPAQQEDALHAAAEDGHLHMHAMLDHTAAVSAQ